MPIHSPNRIPSRRSPLVHGSTAHRLSRYSPSHGLSLIPHQRAQQTPRSIFLNDRPPHGTRTRRASVHPQGHRSTLRKSGRIRSPSVFLCVMFSFQNRDPLSDPPKSLNKIRLTVFFLGITALNRSLAVTPILNPWNCPSGSTAVLSPSPTASKPTAI